jgi:hypothetical protein
MTRDSRGHRKLPAKTKQKAAGPNRCGAESAWNKGEAMIRFRTMSGILWLILALALHVCPSAVTTAHGQGSRKDDIVFNTRGVPLAGATVRVCAMPASGQPCAPLALIYSDAALTQALANPTASDGMGNYNFYAAPGKYEIEISGPGITTKQIPNVILPSDPSAPTFNSISSTGGINAFSLNLTGNLTVNGSTTVVGNLASGSLNLTNVATPPGAPGAGTINLYGKSVDKRLYYKDETGVEIGPISTGGSGAQTNLPNTFTAPQTIDADFRTKGPNPSYDVTRYGGYVGPNYNTPTTGSISSGTTTLTLANALDFANLHGILILGAGPSPTIATPTGVTAAAVGVTGSATYYYCVVDEDYADGRTACSAAGSVSNAVATLGLQTATLVACNRASGVVTCQTSAAHNFVSGSQVDIPRNSTGDGSFEGTFTITSIPDSTHFTFTQYGVADKSGSVTTGTARVAGRVAVKWNAPTNHTVAKHIIYRCSTTCALPANASNYTAVGVAIGNDSYYLDRGYGLYSSAGLLASLDNGDAPSTAPTVASNQWLPTTVAAGGGTTSITVANAASHTVSGAKVLHDNTPNLKAACGAIITGGTVLVPATLNSAYEFPIASLFDMSACVGQIEIDFGTEVWATAPIVPRIGSKLKGIASGSVTQTPNFYGVNNIAWFNGFAYPFIFMAPAISHDLSLEALQFACNQADQSCIYQDAGTDGSGVISIRYTDVYSISGSASTGYVAKGGFGYFWNGGGWSSTPSDFSSPPAALFTLNCGTGQLGQLLPALLYADKTFAFGGILMDSCGVQTSGSGGGGNMEFRQMLVEGNYGPAFRANILPDATTGVDFYNLVYADFVGGAATPLIDITNSVASAIRVIHPYCATGFQPVLQTSLSTTAYNGIEITNTSEGCNYVGANLYVKRDDLTSVDLYSNFNLAFQGYARSYFIMSVPAPAQSVVASAGGNVAIGTHTYVVTASDYDGGETTASLPITGTATSGNQTLTVTLPATFPPGAAGVNLYRDGAMVSASGCVEPQFTTPGGTFVDTASFTCGSVLPLQTTAGTSTITANGISTTRLRVNGEALTAAPRGEQNIFLPGALTTTWVASTWTPDKAVTVTRLQVQTKTAPAACTSNAVVRLTDGTTAVNLTISGATNDSGALTQNYAAGIPLSLSVQTAAAGCSTAPADANVTIQYRMQ